VPGVVDDGTVREPREPGSALALSVGVKAVVLNGVSKGTSKLIGRRMKIGKADDNHLVLTDTAVSRHHCELLRTKDGIVVRDLESTNGTMVTGARVREVAVPPGTVITVGTVDIALQPSQSLEVAPSENSKFGEAVGKSLAMRSIFGVLEYIAQSDASVLLLGETGTGKDVLARSIAQESQRAKKPFVVVDCAAISYSLVASELFGHEKGAFSGADTNREGAFERAEGGTLFLDEIGELPLDVQPKLLRVLEAKEYKRLGGNRVMHADVRIIAATKRDLEQDVVDGRFREDLYFRLAVVPVTVPPLRQRREDIPMLAKTILGKLMMHGPLLTLTEDAMATLIAYDWPGNVRELRNALDRGRTLSSGIIDATALGIFTAAQPADLFDKPFDEAQREFAIAYAASLRARYGDDLSAASRHAGLSEKEIAAMLESVR
jgi:transcriptional regulator with GAF, ATPase, and Fis domain